MKEYERNTFLSVHPRGTFAELKSFITASQLRFKEGMFVTFDEIYLIYSFE